MVKFQKEEHHELVSKQEVEIVDLFKIWVQKPENHFSVLQWSKQTEPASFSWEGKKKPLSQWWRNPCTPVGEELIVTIGDQDTCSWSYFLNHQKYR